MADWLNSNSLTIVGLIVLVIIAAAFGGIGYLIATRRIKQPIVVFLARFGIVFFLLFFLELAVLALLPSFHAMIRSFAATLVGGVLSIAGASHSITDSIITLQNPYLSFDITEACLGGVLLWTYIALVSAETKATGKQRLVGIFVGLVILLAFNFFRITLSIYLEWLTGFGIHNLFYLFNIVFVLSVWAGWLRTMKPQTAPRPA